jgi:hypothetical protein
VGGTGDTVLLWGDSFAAHYVPGLDTARLSGPLIQYTMQGCPPVLAYHHPSQPGCREFNRHAISIIERQRVRRVVLSADWAEYRLEDAEDIGSTLSALQALGVEVVVLGQSPVFFMDPALIAARQGAGRERDAAVSSAIDAARINAILRRVTETRARLIDPMLHLCPGGPCPIRVAGQNLYFDYGHLTLAGSARAARAYFPYDSLAASHSEGRVAQH